MTTLDSERFVEQGGTGFELVADRHRLSQASAGAKLHYLRDWRFGNDRWMALDLSAEYRQPLWGSAMPWQAAYLGMPDARFALPDAPWQAAGWAPLGLRGGRPGGWQWALAHERPLAGNTATPGWSARLQRGF